MKVVKSNWRLKGEGNEIESESERQFKSKSERESNKQEKEEDIMLMFTNCLPMFTVCCDKIWKLKALNFGPY